MTARIVVVDDHELVRVGLRTLLANHGLHVVAQAGNGADGLALIQSVRPDLAIIDIRMPDMSGIQLCQSVRSTNQYTKLAILTTAVDKDVVHACLQTGVQGYLLKDMPGDELCRAIQNILDGKSVLDPAVTAYALGWIEFRGEASGKDALDLRDVEILRLMARGRTNHEIGQHLHLSENTVKANVNEIYQRFGVRSRVEAVIEAYRRGVL